MKLIGGFIDRVLFTLGVVLLLQLPNFVDQYTQRLGGYYTSEAEQLQKYQSIADENYKGNLNHLIRDFKLSNKPAVARTGKNIESTSQRVVEIRKGLKILEGSKFLPKVFHMAWNTDHVLAADTLKNFKPGIPFTIEALICGIIGGVLFSLIYNAIIQLPGLIIRKIIFTPKHRYIN